MKYALKFACIALGAIAFTGSNSRVMAEDDSCYSDCRDAGGTRRECRIECGQKGKPPVGKPQASRKSAKVKVSRKKPAKKEPSE